MSYNKCDTEPRGGLVIKGDCGCDDRRSGCGNDCDCDDGDRGRDWDCDECGRDCGCDDQLVLGIQTVPMQKWRLTYSHEKALGEGTAFAELNLPFRGGTWR